MGRMLRDFSLWVVRQLGYPTPPVEPDPPPGYSTVPFPRERVDPPPDLPRE
jgi:hypothetical protein